jgi:isopenicillin N synthase-like dioxygenase
MATSFSSLPVVDVGAMKAPCLSSADVDTLSKQLYDVFSTTGFAYLVNVPLSFNHADIFGLAKEFFDIPMYQKMLLAKRSFRPNNRNTYRGYAEFWKTQRLIMTQPDISLFSPIWHQTT